MNLRPIRLAAAALLLSTPLNAALEKTRVAAQ
jgi:hypothetical protein